MERIKPKGLDELKAILIANKEKQGKIVKNFYSMLEYFGEFIESEKLICEVHEDGVFVFLDEGRFYNLIYFWNADKGFPQMESDKDVLIEIQTTNKKDMDDSLKGKLIDAGFRLEKDNIQLEKKLSGESELPNTYLEEDLQSRIKNVESLGYSVEIIKDEEKFQQAVNLWESNLEPIDIPLDHMIMHSEDRVLGIVSQSGDVIGAHWWRNMGRYSEGRHTVVDSVHSRRGLASLLLLYWYVDAQKEGADRAIGWAEKNNNASITAQEKLGAIRNGRGCKQFILKK